MIEIPLLDALWKKLGALYEIKQYRKIGIVEDIKKAINILSLSDNDIITKDFHELCEYRKDDCKDNCKYGFSKLQCCPIVREKFKGLLEKENEV